MPMEISPSAMSAFEARARTQEVQQFAEWWNARAVSLGQLASMTEASALLESARIEGADIGLRDNEDNRLFLQAAATRLMPEPSSEQWLLATDAIFAPASDNDRFARLAAIARDSG